jgi:hypothetical protein
MDAEWEALRRGWYVGGETFLEKLAGHLDGAMKGRQRESHRGEAKVAHDEAPAALALVSQGINRVKRRLIQLALARNG